MSLYIECSQIHFSTFLDTVEVTSTCKNSTSKVLKQITSPSNRQPLSPPNTLICAWNLTTSVLQKVHLGFQYFNRNSSTESDNGTCSFEYLELYEPIDHRYHRTAKICGSKTPENFTSSGNSVVLAFHSTQGLPKHKGFKLTYFSVNPGRYV